MSKEESIVVSHIDREMNRFFMRICYLFIITVGMCGLYFAGQFAYMMYVLYSYLM